MNIIKLIGQKMFLPLVLAIVIMILWRVNYDYESKMQKKKLLREKELLSVGEVEGEKVLSEYTQEVCGDLKLQLGQAREKVRGSEKALEILRDGCLWLREVQFLDLTGDGNEELAMTTVRAGCVSCHGNNIYILKNNQAIFEKAVEDVVLWPATEFEGFEIKYPIRKDNGADCCPSQGIVESYRFMVNDRREYFEKIGERIEEY